MSMCTTYVRNTCPPNAHVYYPHNQRSVHCFIRKQWMKVQDQYLYTRPVGEGVEGPPVKKYYLSLDVVDI